jgi:hypothetical protein
MSHPSITRVEERPPLERQTPTKPNSESNSQGCISGLGSGLAALLFWGGTLLAYLSYMQLNERGPGVTNTDRLGAMIGMSLAVCLLVDSLMAALFLAVRSRWSWYGALMLSLIGFVGSLGLCRVGYQAVVEAQRRWGDSGPLNVVAAWIFGVIVPLGLATFPLGLLMACLLILRARAIEKGKASEVWRDLS